MLKEIEAVKKRDVLIIFHADVDGCCSAALLKMLLEKQGNRVMIASPSRERYVVTKNIRDAITNLGPEVIFVLDMSFPEDELRKLISFGKIIVIDHHVPRFIEKSDQIYVHNPLEFSDKEKEESCSALVYDVCVDSDKAFKKYAWIGALGAYSDNLLDKSPGLLADLKTTKPTMLDKDIYKSKLNRIMNLLNCGRISYYERGAELAVEAIVSSAVRPDSLLNGTTDQAKELKNYEEKCNTEIERVMKIFEKNGEIDKENKTILFRLKSKYNLTTTLSSMITKAFPDYVVVVAQTGTQTTRVEARTRNQGKNLEEIMNRVISIYHRAIAGGYPEAMGAEVPNLHTNMFLRAFMDALHGEAGQMGAYPSPDFPEVEGSDEVEGPDEVEGLGD